MPKLKTKKALAKRFKITKRGKLKRQKAGLGHLSGKKSRKRKRQLRKAGLVSKASRKTLKMLMPY